MPMSLRDTIENNPVIWTLGILLAGFVAGIAAYKGILQAAGMEPIPKTTRILQSGEHIISDADYNKFIGGHTANKETEQKLADSLALNHATN